MSYATRLELTDRQTRKLRKHQSKFDMLREYLLVGGRVADVKNLFSSGTVAYKSLASEFPVGHITREPKSNLWLTEARSNL